MALQKNYGYKVYKPDGTFITEWNDVTSQFAFTQEINGAGSETIVTLARSALSYGEGVDVDFKNRVVVTAYDNDAPNGTVVFQGYISAYKPVFDTQESVQVTVLGYGSELDQFMLENAVPTLPFFTNETFAGGFSNSFNYLGDSAATYPSNYRVLGQLFTATGNYLTKVRGYFGCTPTPGGHSDIIGSVRAAIFTSANGVPGVQLCSWVDSGLIGDTSGGTSAITFTLPNVPVNPGQSYFVCFNARVEGLDINVPQFSAESNADSDARIYQVFNSQASPNVYGTRVNDLKLSVWNDQLDTTVTYNSYDPSDILRDVLTRYTAKGGKISFSNGSVIASNYIPTPSFEVGTGSWTLTPYSTFAPTMTIDTINTFSGTKSLKVTGQEGNTGVQITTLDNFVSVGSNLTLSFYMTTSVAVNVLIYQNGAQLGSTLAITGSGTMQRYTMSVTTSTAGQPVTIYFRFNGTSSSNAFWIDGVMLENDTSAGTYFDGSTAYDGTYNYSWSGTIGNSKSNRTVGASIDTTGTLVSYTFSTNTILEAVKKVLELAPVDWYFYIDQSTNLIHFHKKKSVKENIFTLGGDIISLEPEKRIEPIVNTVYFTGGGNPSLFKKYTRPVSIALYGQRILRYQDQRVILDATADTVAKAILDSKSAPELRINVKIADNNGTNTGVDIEKLRLGMTVGFNNFGSSGTSLFDVAKWDVAYWDFNIRELETLSLQIVKLEYNAGYVTISVSTIPPDVNKRIEDINRNLTTLQTINNPSTPTLG